MYSSHAVASLHGLSQVDWYVNKSLRVSICVDLVGKNVISLEYVTEALSVAVDTVKPTVVDIYDGELFRWQVRR